MLNIKNGSCKSIDNVFLCFQIPKGVSNKNKQVRIEIIMVPMMISRQYEGIEVRFFFPR